MDRTEIFIVLLLHGILQGKPHRCDIPCIFTGQCVTLVKFIVESESSVQFNWFTQHFKTGTFY
jgi:hypothetical protein